jgi:hypothetical protein
VTRLDRGVPAQIPPPPANRSSRHVRGSAKKTRAPRQKGFKGWLKRWWWVFVVVPASAMILVLAMLVYVYAQLELPNTPPPL